MHVQPKRKATEISNKINHNGPEERLIYIYSVIALGNFSSHHQIFLDNFLDEKTRRGMWENI